MPQRRHGRLFLRLALTLGGALTVAFALAAVVSIWIGSRALGESVEQELDGVAHIVHLDLERFLAARRADLQLCAEVELMDDLVLGDSHFRIQNEVLRLSRAYPRLYEELAVVNLQGEVVASTRVDRVGEPLALADLHLVPNGESELIGTGPQGVPGITEPVLVMAHRVRSSLARDPSGWLVAMVRWSALSEIVQGTSVLGRNQSARAFVILMHVTRPIAGRAEWLAGGKARRLIHNEITTHEDPLHYRGNESFVEITGGEHPAGWRVLFYRDSADAFRPVRLFAWSVIAAVVVGLLLAAVLSLRVAREFTRRIDLLMAGTQRLAAGDYEHRVHDEQADELTELGDSFNRMADAVQAARASLEKSNTDLEDSNRRLREVSKLKDEFLANTSHELRTPLNGILGFLGLVHDGLCDTPAEEKESIDQALACARQLLLLIEDLIDVSRIEAGRLAIVTHTVPVMAALERIVAELGPVARERGLELRVEPPLDPALAVRAEPQRLHKILRHLTDNALKFTKHGSVVLTCATPAAAGHARFEVRDTGIGLDPERRTKVFERFVQGDGSATRSVGGTGLGLSLVRDLVEMMGGVVHLTSEGVGHGTTAIFALPLARVAFEPIDSDGGRAPASEPVQGPTRGPLVLLVEDDPALTHWLTAVLHAEGFRTTTVDSAERAWMALRQVQPSVVLTDHALPAASGARFRTGAELARHMAAHRETARIPVILLTGHDLTALEGDRVLPPGVLLLRKPAPREQLVVELWRAVATHAPRAVRLLVAHHDPRLLTLAARAFPPTHFRVSVERNDESCVEVVRSQPRVFDVILLEVPTEPAAATALLEGFAALESAPPLVAVTARAAADGSEPTAAQVTREFPLAELLDNPESLRACLLALGGAAVLPDDETPARAA